MATTPAAERIAVLRALQLGDLLCATPALRALRAGLPKAAITLISLPWAAELARRLSHLVDDFLALPGFPGLPELAPDIGALPAFLARAQARRFDLVLQLHGSGEITNPLAALLGGRRTAGFYRPAGYRPDPELYIPYPEQGPEPRRLLSLTSALGFERRGEHLEFPLDDGDRQELASVAGAERLWRRGYVCVHPGSRLQSRRWDPEAFAAVADRLAERGHDIVVTGTDAERELTAAVARSMAAPSTDLAGRTTLGALGALVEGAALVVTNDTGVSHLAAALGTPSVVVFTASDPARWAPLDRRRHYAVLAARATVPDVVSAAAEVVSKS